MYSGTGERTWRRPMHIQNSCERDGIQINGEIIDYSVNGYTDWLSIRGKFFYIACQNVKKPKNFRSHHKEYLYEPGVGKNYLKKIQKLQVIKDR